jgi:hypothetical protein
VFFQNLSLAFNFCLCHDLIKTLKDPFYPGKRRMKWYFWCSALAAVIFTVITKNDFMGKQKDLIDKYR